MTLFKEFIKQSIEYIEMNLPRLQKCLMEISEEELWQRPNEYSNSVGNLIVHLCGNITQYIHSALGKEPDIRERDLEFNRTGGLTRQEAFTKIEAVTEMAIKILKQQKEKDLVKMYEVQGFRMSGIAIIIHVTEHYSYHVGQIGYYVKMMKNIDLGYYAGEDLNATS